MREQLREDLTDLIRQLVDYPVQEWPLAFHRGKALQTIRAALDQLAALSSPQGAAFTLTEANVEALRRGAHDYNGGHHDDPAHGAFHHGIDTAFNVLASMVREHQSGKHDAQNEAVRQIGGWSLPQGARPTWQDISTAPRDGTEILLLQGRSVANGTWNNGGAFFMPHWMTACNLFEPSHWMPLPEPPLPAPSSAPPPAEEK